MSRYPTLVMLICLGLLLAPPARAADTTPPVIVPTLTGTLGANGWYVSTVKLAWTVTDAESAITKKTGCTAASVTADTAGTTYPCSATSTGGTASTSVVIKRDATLPTVTITTPKAAAAYKQGQAVLASYACADARSGVASCAGTLPSGTALDTTTIGAKTFTVTATDNAGNVKATTVSYTVTDATPPVVTSAVTGTAGLAGWYTSNVGVAWTVTDPQTAVTTQTGCTASNVIADTLGTTLTCTATSGGGTTKSSVVVKRDATAPVVTVTVPANGATYKTGTPVASNYACSDATSGLATCTGTVAKGAAIDISTLGAKTFTVAATDKAGNARSVSVGYTVVDGTPPVITPAITGAKGLGGWYSTNVDVSWTVTDPETAVTTTTGCVPASVTADTTGVTFTCSATSSGGTASAPLTIRRDTVPPTAIIAAPLNGARFKLNDMATASFTCGDALSGVYSCLGSVGNGVPIDTTMPGRQSFRVTATDNAGNTYATSVSYTVDHPTTSSASGNQLLAWNDLGMHCADSDYSVFTLLPPFNTVNAQLVVGGRFASAGYTLTYEATPDGAGSINTSSSGKANFWEWAPALFGVTIPFEYGVTGNPMATTTPAPLAWSAGMNLFEATGIPILPIDDTGAWNPYPMVKITARNATTGAVVASTTAVLPVSSEINCMTCHGSASGSAAAQPVAGWVTDQPPGSETEWRLNVLRIHDEKNAGNPSYVEALTSKEFGAGLESSARGGKPVFCDHCHLSNAVAGLGFTGVPGISTMTSAMHGRHAAVYVPGETLPLDAVTTRSACYNCHPGAKTECLRGAMGNPVDAATGGHVMECQSCHGSMATVANPLRTGWLDMPTCQGCHHDGIRDTTAILPGGAFKTTADTRFASNTDTPATGWSLYRMSVGHGLLQCEACHNSTHAEFTNKPSANGNQVNDNLRAISLQGYPAAVRECSSCHASVPLTGTGGPHGMHTVGSWWVTNHKDWVTPANVSDCKYCHGSTSAGSPLAVMKVSKTFQKRGSGQVTYAVEAPVTCWDCHPGPMR